MILRALRSHKSNHQTDEELLKMHRYWLIKYKGKRVLDKFEADSNEFPCGMLEECVKTYYHLIYGGSDYITYHPVDLYDFTMADIDD